ncbi:hypothetical protein Tco_1063274 [Tanacetum coccineum]
MNEGFRAVNAKVSKGDAQSNMLRDVVASMKLRSGRIVDGEGNSTAVLGSSNAHGSTHAANNTMQIKFTSFGTEFIAPNVTDGTGLRPATTMHANNSNVGSYNIPTDGSMISIEATGLNGKFIGDAAISTHVEVIESILEVQITSHYDLKVLMAKINVGKSPTDDPNADTSPAFTTEVNDASTISHHVHGLSYFTAATTESILDHQVMAVKEAIGVVHATPNLDCPLTSETVDTNLVVEHTCVFGLSNELTTATSMNTLKAATSTHTMMGDVVSC